MSAADTVKSSTAVLVPLTPKAGRARAAAAESPTPQPIALSAVRRAKVSGNVPMVIVFHPATSETDVTGPSGLGMTDVVLTVNSLCNTSRAEHCALASLVEAR